MRGSNINFRHSKNYPQKKKKLRNITFLNVPTETPDEHLTDFLNQYADSWHTTSHIKKDYNGIFYMTGTHVYQVKKLHQHIPCILPNMFGRKSYVYMTTNQSTNKEKQKQLTETEHRHTPTPKTNTQKNPKPMTKTKIHDTHFEKLQQNQLSIIDNQKNIEKNIQQTNITTRKAITNSAKPYYKIDNPTPTLDNNNFPQLPKQTEKEDDQQQQKTTDNQKTQMTSETMVIPETPPEDMPDIMAIPETDLEAMPQMQTPEILSPSAVTNNKFQTLKKTPDITQETIDPSTPNINDIATNNELIALDQQQQKAKTLATQLHKRSFIDTGCLINATKTEKERLLALAM